MWDFKKMASYLAKKEDGKSRAKVGDVREILRLLCDILSTDEEALRWFKAYLIRVHRRNAKKNS